MDNTLIVSGDYRPSLVTLVNALILPVATL